MTLALRDLEVSMKFNRISVGFAALTFLMASAALAGQHGQTPHAQTTHGQTTHGQTTHGASAKPTATAPKPAGKPTTKTTTTTTTTTTTPTTTTTTTSPIATKIESHPQLAAKLTTLLPKGMTLQTAAMGFKNQGQFIAALHVSKNLNIPFAQLQTAMTGEKHESLGQAIHELRPSTDSTKAAKHAEAEAAEDAKIH
jgi:hypothetical protein